MGENQGACPGRRCCCWLGYCKRQRRQYLSGGLLMRVARKLQRRCGSHARRHRSDDLRSMAEGGSPVKIGRASLAGFERSSGMPNLEREDYEPTSRIFPVRVQGTNSAPLASLRGCSSRRSCSSHSSTILVT